MTSTASVVALMGAAMVGAAVPASAAMQSSGFRMATSAAAGCSVNAVVAEDITFSFSDQNLADTKAQIAGFGSSFVGSTFPSTLGVTSFGAESPLNTAPRLTGVDAVAQAGADQFGAQVAGYGFEWPTPGGPVGSWATNWQAGLQEAFQDAKAQGATTIAFVTDGVPNSFHDANGQFVYDMNTLDPRAADAAKVVADQIRAAGITIVPIFIRTNSPGLHGLDDPVAPTSAADAEAAMAVLQPGWTIDKAISISTLGDQLRAAALTNCAPSIDVSKNAEGDDSTEVTAGVHPITTTYVNNGRDALKDLTFTDTTLSGDAATWDQGDLDKLKTLVLKPGESFTVHGTADVKYGVTHKDNVTVTGTGVITGTPVKDEDPTTLVPKPETPGIDVSKNKEGDDLNKVEKGTQDVVTTIKNPGTEPLGSLVFGDKTDAGSDVKWSQADLDKLKTLVLKPGESLTVHGTLTLKAGESHKDTVTVTGKGMISGTPVKDADPTRYETPQEPKIDVSKNAEGDDQVVVDAGEQHITASIKNPGTEPMKDFTFSDKTSSGAVATWNQGDLAALKTLVLKPGESFTVHGTVTVKAGETHKDTVTVTATGVISGKTVTDEDPTTLVPPAVPGVPQAHTGGAISDTNPLVPIGLGAGAVALAAGAALTLVIRKRRSATESE